MSKKPGRNDPCYCGSGKKYKKCHWLSDHAAKNKPNLGFMGPDLLEKIYNAPEENLKSNNNLRSLKIEFSKYNQIDLIKSLAALQLCPENHSHLIRLEVATRIACSIKKSSNKKISRFQLEKLLLKYMPAESFLGLKEDPVEGLFTNNIMFFGENYTIFSGLYSDGYFVLQKILEAIFIQFPKDFPFKFKYLIYLLSESSLLLSNYIANYIEITTNYVSEDTFREEIYFPNFERFKKLKKSISIPFHVINQIFDNYGMDYRILNNFYIELGSDELKKENLDENPLFNYPLTFFEENVIVISPSSFLMALINKILKVSFDFHLKDFFIEKYTKVLWNEIIHDLNQVFIKKIDFNKLNNDKISLEEEVFQIDQNKLVYVCLITDLLNDFNYDKPVDTWDFNFFYSMILEHFKEISKDLKKGFITELSLLIIVGECGRVNLYQSLDMQDYVGLIIKIEELNIILKNYDLDNLSLYNFSKLLKETNFGPNVVTTLDYYAIFKEYQDSFYLSDDKNDIIIIPPNSYYGRNLRIKSIKNKDMHYVDYDLNSMAIVSKSNDYPIYNSYNKSYILFVDNYYQPIWVELVLNDNPCYNILISITNAIAYWLWQFTDDLKEHFKKIDYPIHIYLNHNFKDLENLDLFELSDFRENTFFTIILANNGIMIELQDSFLNLINLKDNSADRKLMYEVIKSLGKFINYKGFSNTLNESEINKIINNNAPLGLKKNILLSIYPFDNNLINEIPIFRKVQEYNIQKQLDNLTIKIDTDYKVNQILTQQNKRDLCNNILKYYFNELENLLSVFNWEDLIKKLIKDYESLLYHRFLKNFQLIPFVQCYSKDSNIIKNITKETNEIDRTAIVLRTLIEMVSAKQVKGDKNISYEEFDNLLSLCWEFINWAFIKDIVKYKILDVNLHILNSGRIGVSGDMLDFMNPYQETKTEERINNHYEFYQDLENNENNLVSKKIDSIFKSEFDITFTDLNEFSIKLKEISLQTKMSVIKMLKKDLINEIVKNSYLTSTHCEIIINNFSLKYRNKWQNPPEYYDKSDISPWKSNRRLSYIYRPLVMNGNNKDNPLIFCGPDNFEDSIWILLNLIRTGTYKFSEEFSSKKLKKFCGKQRFKRGHEFTKKVEEWFKFNSDFIINSEVPIGPNEILKSDINYGDIDILLLDIKNESIFLVECKDIKSAHNPYEIYQEIEKFSKGEKSFMSKHSKRNKWVNNNIDLLEKYYNKNLTNFKVFSLFITSKEIPSKFLKNMIFPIFSFYQLKKDKLKIFQTKKF